MEEREFFDERPEKKMATLNCPHCHQPAEYEVTWIGTALARFDHVVTIGAEPFCQPMAGTPIHQELHGVVTCTASRESWAMTARA